MHIAVENRNVDACCRLLEAGVDVNVGRGKAPTALHLMGACGDIAMGKYLLDMGADPKCEDHNSNFPIVYALEKDNFKFADWLRKMGGGSKNAKKTYR
jgi:ankyrin repeat protein